MDEIIDRKLNDRMDEYEQVSKTSLSLRWATMCDQELRLIMESSLVIPLFEFHFRTEFIFCYKFGRIHSQISQITACNWSETRDNVMMLVVKSEDFTD